MLRPLGIPRNIWRIPYTSYLKWLALKKCYLGFEKENIKIITELFISKRTYSTRKWTNYTKPEAKNYSPSLQSCLMSNTVRIDSLFLHSLFITLAFVLIFQLTHKVQTDAFRILSCISSHLPIWLTVSQYFWSIDITTSTSFFSPSLS